MAFYNRCGLLVTIFKEFSTLGAEIGVKIWPYVLKQNIYKYIYIYKEREKTCSPSYTRNLCDLYLGCLNSLGGELGTKQNIWLGFLTDPV